MLGPFRIRPTLGRARDQAGYALLMAILIIAALAMIGAPFAVSMRLHERGSRNALARVKAKYAALGAANHAIGSLLRTHRDYEIRFGVFPFNTPYLDVEAEFRFNFDEVELYAESRNPKGSIWAVEVEDEQGKINVNSAPRALLVNLFKEFHADLGWTEAKAEAVADQIDLYRKRRSLFRTITELKRIADFGQQAFSSEEIAELRHYLTVSSSRPNSAVRHPINLNTADRRVLRTVLRDVRLREVTPVKGGSNVGDGVMSKVRLPQGLEVEETWTVTCADVSTDDVGIRTFTFTVQGALSGNHADYVITNDNSPDYQSGPGTSVDDPAANVRFTIYNGETDFAQNDSFTFSTEGISPTGSPSKLDKVVDRLRPTTTLAADIATSATQIELADATMFPLKGWIRIGDDLIYYDRKNATNPDILEGIENLDEAHLQGDEVRLYFSDFTQLASCLEQAVEATPPDLNRDDMTAILVNAGNPRHEKLAVSTTSFCFESKGVFAIEATGLINDQSGKEIARHRVRQVVEAEPSMELEWEITSQDDFDEQIRALQARLDRQYGLGVAPVMVTSFPNPTIIKDMPAARGTDLGRIKLRTLRVRDNDDMVAFVAHYDTTFSTDAMDSDDGFGSPVSPTGTRTAAVTLDDRNDLNPDATITPPADYQEGVWLETPDSLGYFTEGGNFQDLGRYNKMLELWFRPVNWQGGQDHFFFDMAFDAHQSRLALFYDGGTDDLVFRLADCSKEARSAEMRSGVSFTNNRWYHLAAIWNNIGYGHLALLLNGRSIGGYYPSAKTSGPQSLSFPPGVTKAQGLAVGSEAVLRVGNRVIDQWGSSRNTREDVQIPAHVPVTVYGYSARFGNNDRWFDPEDDASLPYAGRLNSDFDVLTNGGGTLNGGISDNMETMIKMSDDHPAGDPRVVPAGATEIPVTSTDGFPEAGYIKIHTGGAAEVVYYNGFSTATDGTTPQFANCTRGVTIGTGSSSFSSAPADHNEDDTVIGISLRVTDNTVYPSPRYSRVAGPSPPAIRHNDAYNYVHIDGEWFAYTHKPTTEFLVNVNASVTGSPPSSHGWRAGAGTGAAAHASGSAVFPVYEVSGVRMGPGDVVTILDDKVDPDDAEQLVIQHTAALGTAATPTLVSFTTGFNGTYLIRVPKPPGPPPDNLNQDVALNARIVKFPEGGLRRKPTMWAGSDSGPGIDASDTSKDTQVGAVIDEVKISSGDGSMGVPRLYDPVGGIAANANPPFTIRIGNLDSVFDGTAAQPVATEIEWGFNGAITDWPTEGYIKIDDECFYYRCRYTHAWEHRYSGSITDAHWTHTQSQLHVMEIPASGNIVWDQTFTYTYSEDGNTYTVTQDAGADPIEAGFNPHGGYITLTSSGSSVTLVTGTPDLTRTTAHQQQINQLIDEECTTGQNLVDDNFVLTYMLPQGGGADLCGGRPWVFNPIYDPDGDGVFELAGTGTPDHYERHSASFTERVYYNYITRYPPPVTPPPLNPSATSPCHPDRTVAGWTGYLFVVDDQSNRGILDSPNPRQHHRFNDPPPNPDLQPGDPGYDPGPTWRGSFPGITGNIVELEVLRRGDANPQRGALGTAREDHARGSSILPLYHIPTTFITGPPSADGNQIYVEDVAGFPARGYLEIADLSQSPPQREIISYTGSHAPHPEYGSDHKPAKHYFSGCQYFRGRFGTTPIDLTTPALTDLYLGHPRDPGYLAQIQDYTDSRRILTYFPARYPDRFPKEFDFSTATWQDGPLGADNQLAMFEASKQVKNARWKSINWKEGPQVSGQLDNRFDVIVLVRIDGRPSWAGATLDWDDQTITGSGEANQYRHPSGVIYKFDEPTEPNYIYGYDDGGNLKSRGEYGNSIQVRVLFKYTDNFSVDDWASAFIESITVKYDAPYTVKHHEELEF